MIEFKEEEEARRKRMNLISKVVHGGRLTKKEGKQVDIWRAELAEYLVWHQEP